MGGCNGVTPVKVRISVATPDADLDAVVWPGVEMVYLPRVETPEQVGHADAVIVRFERLRGIRPRTVQIRPLIETPMGVSAARAIARSSERVRAFGLGPQARNSMEGDALAYARGECELIARSRQIMPVDLEEVLD